ncbi:MAG: hypothetical protein KDA79_20520 [Planctomycetaceae bacterium]|nr:hypothetical protein [Planctomycetaceae bacterium]
MSSSGQPVDRNRQVAPAAYMLWIDGEGGWLVLLKDRVTIGGPSPAPEAGGADLSLLAELSRVHATIARTEENYLVEPHGGMTVCGRPVTGPTHLNDGYELQLGERVRLNFRLPTALSATAVLEFASDHRPSRSVDGVVLMHETLLVGPGTGNHINCPGWKSQVVLFLRDGRLWCRSRAALRVGKDSAGGAVPLEADSLVSGEDFCFRLETVDLTADSG